MTGIITAAHLDAADDPRYSDFIVKFGLKDDKTWALMLSEPFVDRTLEQARLYQNGGDPDWRKRCANLLRRVRIYRADAKNEVKRLNRAEYEQTAHFQATRWKAICGTLVDLLDGNPALGLIVLPGGGTAAQWADLRAGREVEVQAAA